MKRFTAIFAALVVLVFFTTNTFAQSVTSSNATALVPLKGVKCFANSNQVKIEMYLDSYKGYKITSLTAPNRIVIDIPNASTKASQQRIDVKSNLVKSVRYAQFQANTARIVVDTIAQPQYVIDEQNGKLVLYIVTPISKGISYYVDDNGATLIFSGTKLVENSTLKKLYTEKYELSGKKYTMTFPSSLAKLENKTIKINDGILSSIQTISDKVTQKTSIIFTAKDKFYYNAAIKPDVNGSKISITRTPESDRGDVDRDPLPSTVGVTYSSKGSIDQVALSVPNYTKYNVMRLTDTDRIVVDITNVKGPDNQQTININSSMIKTVRYAQYDSNVARVVIDTIGQVQYNVDEGAGQLVLSIEKPTFHNITYKNNGDRIALLLDGAKLTEGDSDLKKLYTESYDSTGKQYTITFPSNLADIGSGAMNINDALLDSIEVVQNDDAQTTSIIFNAKDKFVYLTITRSVTDDTAITILKPASKEDRLVVIDPGHGGAEPGAIYGDLQEKDFNLDISLRLNALLKSKGIKTYMTREDDSYVGLYERAYIANNLNAELFLCVHNNAYNSSEYGTETLYYPSKNGLNFGKKFAQIIQDKLVNNLGTLDRKIVERPGLVVLKATTMPAALAEVAFLTNPNDRANLLNDQFRQKAAQALCDSVIEALNEDQ